MKRLLTGFVRLIRTAFKSRIALVIENIALRQQLAVFKVKKPRPKLTPLDRAFWVLLHRAWPKWSEALIIVKPETVVGSLRYGGRPPEQRGWDFWGQTGSSRRIHKGLAEKNK